MSKNISFLPVSLLGTDEFGKLKNRYQPLLIIVKSPKLDNYISFSVLLVGCLDQLSFNKSKSLIVIFQNPCF